MEIDGCEVSQKALAIPLAILELAKNLELNVVAEGVETIAQQDCLVEHGCDIIQGYLFSRPVSADQFAGMLGVSGENGFCPSGKIATIPGRKSDS